MCACSIVPIAKKRKKETNTCNKSIQQLSHGDMSECTHVPRCPCCLFTCLWDDCQWTALDSTEFFLTSFSSAKELCMQLWSPPLSEFSTFCLNRSALSAFQRCVGAAAFFSLRSWHARRRLVSTHLSLSNTRPKWVQTCDTTFCEVLTRVKLFEGCSFQALP